MTDAMKRKFLRGEGWERRWYSLFGGRDRLSYWDPVTADHLFDLDLAYRIATRRKADRDRRRAIKAGWRHRVLGDGLGGVYRDWYLQIGPEPGKTLFAKTVANALALLDGG